jgi:hypothetical protein
MKKHFLYLTVAALASGLAACTNDELEGSSAINNEGGFTVTASIEDADVPTTRVGIADNYAFSWVDKDAIAMFDGNVSANEDEKPYQFAQKIDEKTNALSGFKKAESVTLPAGFAPNYAFYPYEQLDNGAELSLGEFFVTLPGVNVTQSESVNAYTDGTTIDWKEGEVKMPMAGAVTMTGATSAKISFKNLTALMKLTVKNIPSDYTKAVLENTGESPIAGSATVNVEDASNPTLTLNNEGGKKAIVYTWTNGENAPATSTKVFYFVVPAGNYSTGLSFYLDKDTPTANSALVLYEKALGAKRNYVYKQTFSLSADGKLEPDVITEANEKLAGGATKVEIDLSKIPSDNGSNLIYSYS